MAYKLVPRPVEDVGNANFRDQIRRAESLEARGLRFLGMGVSGGAEGARKGPAFFPGGASGTRALVGRGFKRETSVWWRKHLGDCLLRIQLVFKEI